MVKTTYQRKNGELVDKITYFNSNYKIGQENGYGWKVVDITYLYKGKYYHVTEYDKLIDKSLKRSQLKTKIINRIKKTYRELGYIIILLTLMRIFEIVLDK